MTKITDRFVDARFVAAFFGGKSKMWINRRLRDGFLPQPTKIAGRNHWRESEILRLADSLTAPAAGTAA